MVAISADGGSGSLLDLKDLPTPVLHIVQSAYGDATGYIFAIAAVVSAISLITALCMKEKPLRTSVHLDD